MFLEDELIAIGKKYKNADVSAAVATYELHKAIFSHISKSLGDEADMHTINSVFTRVNRSWKKAAKKIKEDTGLPLREDGFIRIIASEKKFKDIVIKD